MLKKIGTLIGAGALALSAMSAMAPAASAETVLTAASCFPMGHPVTKPLEKLIGAINEAGKGKLKIDLKGGAPAIGSPFTLTQKMSKGVYDFVGCTEAYFGNVIPEAPVLRFSEYPFDELRKRGGIDYVAKLMAAKGIHYVGRYHDFGPFHLWLSKKIDKPDLTGLHLRSVPVYTPLFKALGATVQTATTAQIYTYMENGTVQGYGWPALGWVPSWIKVTKYRVEPGFYASSLHAMVNKRKWKSLSKEEQDIITNTVMAFEATSETSSPAFQAALKKQKDYTASKGLAAIEFTGADREKWVNTARDSGWAEVLERSPEHGPKLKEIFTK